ncbi:MAG: NAD(P)-binding domain-containing protein [Gammaproteobacteria bacterium]|nr:NAD(P)-binding domain-containing protein [Gammaproteobacteria bacterium]
MTSTSPTEQQIALIGAGPAGLAMAQNCAKLQIPFQGFESHNEVGGLWNINNPQSTMYSSAHLISSAKMTEFTEFPMPQGTPDYPSHSLMCAYFQAYADAFDLRKHYRFNTKVLSVKPLTKNPDSLWQVDTQSTTDASIRSAVYQGVVIASGTLSYPNLPKLKGQFDGEMWHTAQYKSPEQLAGKRVLIVGAGNSGCDIAVDAAHHAQSVDISVRRGYYFVPKYIFGKPADTIGGKIKLPRRLKQRIDAMILRWFTGDPSRFGFPKPNYKIYESHPIVNSLILYHIGHGNVGVKPDISRLDQHTVWFQDGSHQSYDLILLATGYQLHYPFIDKTLLNWQGFAPQLFLNIFSPHFRRLAVVGMVESNGLGWQGRYEQAKLVAAYWQGLASVKQQSEQLWQSIQNSQPDVRGGYPYLPLERMAYYVQKDVYLKELQKAYATLQ